MSVNDPLKWLESVQLRAKELRAEEAKVQLAIRNGLQDRAIVFIDIVDSTAFKQKHLATPEVWILRVRQFSELLAEAVKSCNGHVVKFIGDEIMAVFESIYDAQNLITRIDQIESNLSEATGHETKVKITADFGKVYFLQFPGHDEPDPQGPAVDRCARIGKFAQASQVLASAEFATGTPKLGWHKVGNTDLKGLGVQGIYQLEKVTVDLTPLINIKEDEYNNLKIAVQDMQFEIQQLRAKNESLANELKSAGVKPDTSLLASSNDKEVLLEEIFRSIKGLKNIIRSSPVPSAQYARFLFLWSSGVGERYNKFEGRVFDESIEANLVKYNTDEVYVLDETHPRNVACFKQMEEVEQALGRYLEKYDQNETDLFRWELSDPEFWDKFIGFNVSGF